MALLLTFKVLARERYKFAFTFFFKLALQIMFVLHGITFENIMERQMCECDFGATHTLLLGPKCMNEASRIKGGMSLGKKFVWLSFQLNFNDFLAAKVKFPISIGGRFSVCSFAYIQIHSSAYPVWFIKFAHPLQKVFKGVLCSRSGYARVTLGFPYSRLSFPGELLRYQIFHRGLVLAADKCSAASFEHATSFG